MRTNMKRLAVIGIILMLLLSVCTAMAEKSAPIEVKVSLEGIAPDTPETYTFRLTADGDYPMPEGASGKNYDLKISGAGSASFPGIEFDQIGIYTYTVKQIPGTTDGVTYDSDVYNVKITVYYKDDGSLATAVAIRKDGSDEKVPIEFINEYPAEQTSRTVIKIWDDKNNKYKKRPSQLKVKLKADGVVIDTVTLNEANEWTATVTGLPVSKNGKKITYTWTEEKITDYKLSKTKVEVTPDGEVTTLTNKPDLHGTPIPPDYGEPLGFGAFINIGDCVE